MSVIFESSPDRDGDYVEVEEVEDPDRLTVAVWRKDLQGWNTAYVPRSEVVALRYRLGKWLERTQEPLSGPDKAPQPTAVLHLSEALGEFTKAFSEYSRTIVKLRAEQVQAATASMRGLVDALGPYMGEDPDPQDVGHPTPPETDNCVCGHAGDKHTPAVGCLLTDPENPWVFCRCVRYEAAEVQPLEVDAEICVGGHGCTSLGVHRAYGTACGRPTQGVELKPPLPVRTPGATEPPTLKCNCCGHRKEVHGEFGCTRMGGQAWCTCLAFAPAQESAPAPECTCEIPASGHFDDCPHSTWPETS